MHIKKNGKFHFRLGESKKLDCKHIGEGAEAGKDGSLTVKNDVSSKCAI